MRCTIYFHIYNSTNVKNTHGGVLLLVKLQAEACNFIKRDTPPWVFFTFFELYKWYQITQRITYTEIKSLVSYIFCASHTSKYLSLNSGI